MAGGYGNIEKTFNLESDSLKAKIIGLIYPPMPTINIISKKDLIFIRKSLFSTGEEKVLNIGSGAITGVGHRLWTKQDFGNVTHLDIEKGEDVDIVGDAHDLPFEKSVYDSVIMQAVIEHLHSPSVAIKEAFRVLRKGGYLYLEVPFLQGFHADPHDYQRYTLNGLERLTEKYGATVILGVSSGPFSFLVWWIRDFFSNITSFRLINLIIRFILSWIFFPLKYLDLVFRNTESAKRLACEYFILIKKN